MKNKTNTQEDHKDNDVISNYYLSSDEGDKEREPIAFQNEDDQESVIDKIIKQFFFILALILYFASYIVIVIPLSPFVFLYKAVMSCVNYQHEELINIQAFIQALVYGSSIFYILIKYFVFQTSKENEGYIYEDAIFFFFTTVLAFSFIKTAYINSTNIIEIIFHLIDEQSVSSIQYSGKELEGGREAYLFDFKSNNQYNLEHTDRFKELSNISKGISLFQLNKSIPSLGCGSLVMLNGFNFGFSINYQQYMILVFVILTKLSFMFYYYYTRESDFTQKEIIDFSVITFFFLYTTWSLHRALSNIDLLRKEEIVNRLNSRINLSDYSRLKLEEKLDVTCPVSIEVWDNMRKYILELDQEHLASLELSYFCLLFQFIFVSVVILSYYFELNWILEKESFLMRPAIVIMSTFNFILFTCFLFFRFWHGSKYNDAIDNLRSTISSNIDAVEDIYTMFNQLFYLNKKTNDSSLVNTLQDRNSPQAIVIKRIKLSSKCYIEGKKKYFGVIYDKSQKDLLRKKMTKNIILSLKKVKQSIENDTDQFKYKFLNVLEINFTDILVTFIFGIITILPSIIPKFLEFYNPNPNPKKE